MKWVNPPVAFMLHAGVPRLLAADAALPGLHPPLRVAGASRIALEAYPGLLARELIGRRSYKSDLVAGQTVERREARADLLAALEQGAGRLGLRLSLDPGAARRVARRRQGRPPRCGLVPGAGGLGRGAPRWPPGPRLRASGGHRSGRRRGS